MIRKINKIMALILIAASINTISSVNAIDANAAVNDNSEINLDSQINNITLASSSDEAALETVEAAMIPGKLSNIYGTSVINPTSVTVSQFEKCGTLSYTLNDTAAGQIAATLSGNMGKIATGIKSIYDYGQNLAAHGEIEKGKQLMLAAGAVGSDMQNLQKSLLSNPAQLTELIKTEAKNIPVYKYTVVGKDGSPVAQGFAVGGTLGLALNPCDTYNAIEKTATYSSIALIPSLPLSGSSTYGHTIDLNASGTSVVCDGLNINVIDSSNNKIYAINNPVYSELKNGASSETETSPQKDTLNLIDFSGVTNLKGSTTSIDISSKGIGTTLLSISLTTKDLKNKNYKYALPIEKYENDMIDSVIDSINLSNAGDLLKGMIKTGTYTMIPNVNSDIDNVIENSGIGKAVDDVTNSLDNISDALNRLTDALEDKNDDVDDAWDKVFDRFDNEPGWGKKDGYIYYYDKDGVSLKGVQKIKGKTYYFNRIDGAMETGWQIVDGKKCYFDKKKGYEVYNQWVQDEDDWYFVGEDGVVKKMEWVNDGGKYYYLKADGKMARNWLKVDDYWYCFNENGSMVISTWKWSDGKWYYLKDNGQSATNWTQIGDKWYYFKDPSGEMQTGWFRANGNWYCTNDDGSMKTGWVSSKDGLCYLDDNTGIMKKNEWATIDGKTYYFNINGAMVTGSKYIDGTKYNFNSDGTLSE